MQILSKNLIKATTFLYFSQVFFFWPGSRCRSGTKHLKSTIVTNRRPSYGIVAGFCCNSRISSATERASHLLTSSAKSGLCSSPCSSIVRLVAPNLHQHIFHFGKKEFPTLFQNLFIQGISSLTLFHLVFLHSVHFNFYLSLSLLDPFMIYMFPRGPFYGPFSFT